MKVQESIWQTDWNDRHFLIISSTIYIFSRKKSIPSFFRFHSWRNIMSHAEQHAKVWHLCVRSQTLDFSWQLYSFLQYLCSGAGKQRDIVEASLFSPSSLSSANVWQHFDPKQPKAKLWLKMQQMTKSTHIAADNVKTALTSRDMDDKLLCMLIRFETLFFFPSFYIFEKRSRYLCCFDGTFPYIFMVGILLSVPYDSLIDFLS